MTKPTSEQERVNAMRYAVAYSMDRTEYDDEKYTAECIARHDLLRDCIPVPKDELAQLRADAERGRRALKILIETVAPTTRSVLPAQYLLDQGLAYLKEIGFTDSDGQLTTEANAFHRAATMRDKEGE